MNFIDTSKLNANKKIDRDYTDYLYYYSAKKITYKPCIKYPNISDKPNKF